MIASLRGVLLEREPSGRVVVEAGGVGYAVTVTATAAAHLGEVGGEVFLHVHHHIRDDTQQLFGFVSRDERAAFEALLAAHGVGPALALAILSVHDPFTLRQVVLADDVDALCLVPGVGKKTAARLLIELKSRLDLPMTSGDAPVSSGSSGAVAARTQGSTETINARADVREALAALGYTVEEVLAVLRELPETADASVLLRDALQLLAVR